jgi:hypothetical protein
MGAMKVMDAVKRAEENRDFTWAKSKARRTILFFLRRRSDDLLCLEEVRKALQPAGEIGGVYFVRDGNHRVSVARLHDVAYIDAEITSLRGTVHLDPGVTMVDVEQLVRAAEIPYSFESAQAAACAALMRLPSAHADSGNPLADAHSRGYGAPGFQIAMEAPCSFAARTRSPCARATSESARSIPRPAGSRRI